MRFLEFREFETQTVALTHTECAALRAHVHDLLIEPAAAGEGWFDVTPQSWVGAVRTPTLAVVIRPKLAIDRLLFLVSYGLDPDRWKSLDEFDLDRASCIVEAIVPTFVHHVRQAVRRGLLQQYRTEEDSLPVLRGRLDLNRHVSKRFCLAPPVDVTFDDFTADHLLHRLIKAALPRLERMPLRSLYARRLLHATLPLFHTVSVVSFHRHQVPEVPYSRLTRHYRPAVELARLILQNTTFDQQHGDVGATSFLLDMNAVFETFLYEALKEELGVAYGFERNRRITLDIDGRVSMRPDLCWSDGQGAVFVGDAKYKALKPRGYEHGDIYQLLAYTTALNVPQGLLVYANGEGAAGRYIVRHGNRTLEVMWVSLDGHPAAVLASVKTVADRVRAMRRSALACRESPITPVLSAPQSE